MKLIIILFVSFELLLGTARADEGSDISIFVKQSNLISSQWTPFAQLAMEPLKPYITEFDRVEINGECAHGEKVLCIFILDFGDGTKSINLKKYKNTFSKARNGIISVGTNVILIDRFLLDILLQNMSKEWEQFGRWFDYMSEMKIFGREQYDHLQSVMYNLYSWRMLHVTLLKKSLHKPAVYSNSAELISNLSENGFSKAFGTGISWILFHEIEHLLQQRRYKGSLLSGAGSFFSGLFDRNFLRKLEDEADVVALEKLKALESDYRAKLKNDKIEDADYFQVALSVSSTISWLRFKALDTIFDNLREVSARDLFFRTYYDACDRFANNMTKDIDDPSIKAVDAQARADDDALTRIKFSDYLALSEKEFNSVRDRYLDIALNGTHGFEYYRIKGAVELFTFDNDLIHRWLHNSPITDALMKNLADGHSENLRDVVTFPQTDLKYDALLSMFKEQLDYFGNNIDFKIDKGVRCASENCEIWTVKISGEAIAVGEINYNAGTGLTTLVRLYLKQDLKHSREFSGDLRKCAIAERCLVDNFLGNIKYFLSGEISFEERISPKFKERAYKNSDAKRNVESADPSVLKSLSSTFPREISKEIFMKDKLCAGFSFAARDNKAFVMITKSETDEWVLFDFMSNEAVDRQNKREEYRRN